MNAADFAVTHEWGTGPDGEYCEAVATTRTGRVVSRARLDVSITAQDFIRVYGTMGRQRIEAAVRDTCHNAALFFPG